MRFRSISNKETSSTGRKAAAAPHLAATTTLPDGAKNAGSNRDGAENGSKDESFFEARPWLDSDSEDDFYSVRGDFTPSRGSTLIISGRWRSAGVWIQVDRSKSSQLVAKKQRLIELLQEKQHYDDDEDDSATDISGDMENSTVHAEEHLKKPGRKGGKVNKSSKSGCFPNVIWKHSFKMCRNMQKEQKPK